MKEALTTLDHLPDGLLECSAAALHSLLDGPTLIHLPGEKQAPLFTVALQHGNESVGWEAVRAVLRSYKGDALPRSWSIFIANVEAARHGIRQLDGRPDFNRCWPTSEQGGTPIHHLLREVTEQMRRRKPFASVDVHNNTGLNPHYGAVNDLRHENLRLASLFSRTVMYFTTPKGVQSGTFATFCPAVTVECGQVGGQDGIDHAAQFLDDCLTIGELSSEPLPMGDLHICQTKARVRIRENLSFGFDEPLAQVNLAADLETMNFTPLPQGTRLAQVSANAGFGVVAEDESGQDATGDFFVIRDGELRLRKPAMPSMLTRNASVIQQDCLCYLMEEIAQAP